MRDLDISKALHLHHLDGLRVRRLTHLNLQNWFGVLVPGNPPGFESSRLMVNFSRLTTKFGLGQICPWHRKRQFDMSKSNEPHLSLPNRATPPTSLTWGRWGYNSVSYVSHLDGLRVRRVAHLLTSFPEPLPILSAIQFAVSSSPLHLLLQFPIQFAVESPLYLPIQLPFQFAVQSPLYSPIQFPI